MAVILTKNYLVTTTQDKVENLISKLIASDISFEILDPQDLGEEWNKVQYYEPGILVDSKELELSERVLKEYQPKGLLESFIDHRTSGSLEEVQSAKANFGTIKQVVHKLNQYLDLKNDEIGEGDPTNQIITELKSFLKEYSFDPDKFTAQNYKLIAAYHTCIELDVKLSLSVSKVFSVEEGSKIYFALFSVEKSRTQEFETIIDSEQITYEKIDWNKEIVVWKNKGGLAAFQGIAQSLGTVDTKETDPTVFISIFFTLFFAFCLNDAIYGLVLAAFCGYFLYFKNLKPGFKNIFRLFFYSGLVTIVLGAITNSWAGDLLVNSPVKDLVQSFQLIDTLNPDSPAPVNVFLKNNGGTSPIVFMLALSAGIGLLTILSGYILKVSNSLKIGNLAAFRADISWLLFILSIIATIAVSAIEPTLTSFSSISIIIFGTCLFLFNEGKGILGKIIGGLGSIYGLIGFFADVLSFTRLIAVGLTGGIIAVVINLLATLIFNSINIPVLNIVAAILVLLVGHTFNLVVSLFGAYINPLRLHYVEFMPKFFEGRGRSLKPTDSEFTFMKLNLKSK